MIRIVRAEESHIKDICELWREFMEFSEEIDTIYKARQDSLPVFERDYLRPAMKSDSSLVLATTDGEKAVGYAYALLVEPGNLVDRPDYGCIHDMFVTAGYRRRGIGGKMCDEIVRRFDTKGISRIELEVITGNESAESFWKKHGYTVFTQRLYREI